MTKEQDFLIRHGLHNFVTHARAKGSEVFSIQRVQNRTMVCHAKMLISGNFDTAKIQVV